MACGCAGELLRCISRIIELVAVLRSRVGVISAVNLLWLHKPTKCAILNYTSNSLMSLSYAKVVSSYNLSDGVIGHLIA